MERKTWFVEYASKKHVINSKKSGSFLVRIGAVEKTMVRSSSGREILCQQKPIYEGETKKEAVLAFISEIPSIFLCEEEICREYVANVFSEAMVPSFLKDRIIPKICKDMITMNRRLGIRGFLVEANVQLVIETFLNDNDSLGRRIPTEQDCIICLEELSSDGQRTILTLPCSHSFHKNCVHRWLRCKQLCPTCRDDIQNPRPKK